jgi:anion-transporting  ArsA/GET3 family ATPase
VLTQAVEVTDMLADPERAQVLLVTVPEETPVNETVETAVLLDEIIGLSMVVVNGVYPERHLDGAADPERIRADAEEADVFVPEAELEHLARAAGFLIRRRALQEEQLTRLAERLDLPQVRLPFLFSADLGPRDLEVLADSLAAGLKEVPDTRGAPDPDPDPDSDPARHVGAP